MTVADRTLPVDAPGARTDGGRRGPRRRTARRRALAVLLALGAPAAGVGAVLGAADRPARVALEVAGRPVLHVAVLDAAGNPRSAASLERSLPAVVPVVRGRVRTLYAVDRPRAAAALATATGSGLPLPARPRATSIGAPVVAQALRNNCETAALQVLLATTGMRSDQLALQSELARSSPLDPQAQATEEVWGDPDDGYVGRADGTGPAGGFGVYPGPIARLAARRGRRLGDVTGASTQAVFERVLAGHAVMAWIGLGDGPYRSWRSPSGRAIRVNLNEHTVVLTGVRLDGRLEVVNVLQGTREIWTRAEFERAWELLGRRALAT